MNADKNENDINNSSEEKNLVDETETTTNSQPESGQNQEKVNETEECTEDNKDQEKEQSLKAELEETKDKLLRVLAENENIRKQAEKNRIDVIKYGVQPLARELINVVDNFDRAIDSVKGSTEEKTLEGFKLIEKEIIQILEKFNINKISALGQAFDANLHQAMFEKPSSNFENGTVCEIVQDGYTFHDRLLRPAMVGIAKKEEKEEEEKNKKEKADEESLKENDSDL